MELLQEKRLNQAAYLLEHTAMSVADIAVTVGYDNISYFHRIFSKRYGMAYQMQWRAAGLKGNN